MKEELSLKDLSRLRVLYIFIKNMSRRFSEGSDIDPKVAEALMEDMQNNLGLVHDYNIIFDESLWPPNSDMPVKKILQVTYRLTPELEYFAITFDSRKRYRFAPILVDQYDDAEGYRVLAIKGVGQE